MFFDLFNFWLVILTIRVLWFNRNLLKKKNVDSKFFPHLLHYQKGVVILISQAYKFAIAHENHQSMS